MGNHLTELVSEGPGTTGRMARCQWAGLASDVMWGRVP